MCSVLKWRIKKRDQTLTAGAFTLVPDHSLINSAGSDCLTITFVGSRVNAAMLRTKKKQKQKQKQQNNTTLQPQFDG